MGLFKPDYHVEDPADDEDESQNGKQRRQIFAL